MCDIIVLLEECPETIFNLRQSDIQDEKIAIAICNAIKEVERTHQLKKFEKFFNDYWKQKLKKNTGRTIVEKLEDRMKSQTITDFK